MTVQLETLVRRARDPIVVDATATLVITGLANACLFGFMVVIARLLGPTSYGLFAALFSIVLIAGLGGQVVQTSVAGRVAGSLDVRQTVSDELRTYLRVSVAVSVVLISAAPALASRLDIGSALPVVAVSLVASTALFWAALLGVLQGGGRIRTLSWLMLAQALLRFSVVIVPALTDSMTAVIFSLVASYIPAFALAVRPVKSVADSPYGAPQAVAARVSEAKLHAPRKKIWVTLVVVTAWAFPSAGDVLLARAIMPAHEAGAYATIVLPARVVIFVGVALTAALFARFVSSAPRDALRFALKGFAAAVVLSTAMAAALGAQAQNVMALLFGSNYSPPEQAMPIVLAAGVMWSIGTVLAYFCLARSEFQQITSLASLLIIAEIALPVLLTASAESLALLSLSLGSLGLAGVGAIVFLGSRRSHATISI